jgi:predicted protein tyrosine phosphatase
MQKLLFICGKNRRRSASAEVIFAGMDGIEVSSAGTSPEAECPLSRDLLEWADRVFVMERSQQLHLRAAYSAAIKDKSVVCLNIPDRYSYMQPELVTELRAKVLPLLGEPV